jgi:DNA polymerase
MTSSDPDVEARIDAVPPENYDEETFVPGAGPMDAPLMIVGEAPGAQEVEQGAPFVGNAGRRLDSFLEAAGIDREDCYLTNVVKFRPPENRDPLVGEIRAWRPVLEAELERVDPAVVLTVGNAATRTVLDTDEGITDLRGETFERDGRLVVPTFHPAATFYDGSKRDAIEADLETAAEALSRRR